MTRISEIHGIPANEFAGRAQEVTPTGFVPYLSLTTGEMALWLAAQRAKMLGQWYGNDAPQYAAAANMLENALNKGIHGGTIHFGALPDYLQQVARTIRQAQGKNRPASVSGIVARRGASIGQIIPVDQRLQACIDAESKKIGLDKKKGQERRTLEDMIKAKCGRQFKKEVIINDNLVNMAPHMLYKSLPTGFTLPTEVVVTRKLHRLGVEGIAGVANITDYDLMYQWVENGIIAKNIGAAVGPLNSIQTSLSLSPNADTLLAQYKVFSDKKSKTGGVQGIGIAPAVLAAIVSVVTAAVGAAFAYLTEIRKTEILAMSEAKGFGTPEFSAKQSDWQISGNNPPTTVSGENGLLLIGAAAVAFFLLNDE